MIKPIIHDPQLLSQPSTTAQQADLSIASDLLDTLAAHQEDCVGMAANMIGKHKRIIVVRMGRTNVAMINPHITAKAHPYQATEGCLSLPGQRTVTRFHNITVKYNNLNWQSISLPLSGWVAEIVQHEIDHCDGRLI